MRSKERRHSDLLGKDFQSHRGAGVFALEQPTREIKVCALGHEIHFGPAGRDSASAKFYGEETALRHEAQRKQFQRNVFRMSVARRKVAEDLRERCRELFSKVCGQRPEL